MSENFHNKMLGGKGADKEQQSKLKEVKVEIKVKGRRKTHNREN